MQKKNLLITTLITTLIKILVVVVFGTFCFFNFFQKLDYRLYDSLSHLRKEPPTDENIMIVMIDDESINALGEWPWSRDVIADSLLRMKELGADSALFDIEYISPSKNGIAPDAEERVYTKVAATQEMMSELVGQFSSGLSSGFYKKEEIPEITSDLLENYINPEFDSLGEYITENMARDNDEYFAQCLQFFGKSYLTINHGDLGYPVSKEDIEYIKNRFLKTKVYDPKYLINIGNNDTAKEAGEELGFTPALHKLITRCYGTNFTNSVIDNDGVRRRMQMLFAYDGHYIRQLAFGPYLDIVGSNNLTRQKNEIIVHDAKNPYTGKEGDIKIPLDLHGRLMIDWKRNRFVEDFKSEPFVNLIRLDIAEKNIYGSLVNILSQMVSDENGVPLEYANHAEELMRMYFTISDTKDYLLSKCTGYREDGSVIDGISDEEYAEYFSLRNSFYDSIKEFLDQDYLPGVLAKLDEFAELIDPEIVEEYKNGLSEQFAYLQEDYDWYTSLYSELEAKFKGAYCILGNTATSTTDLGATPFQKKFENVAIHANVLNTLLTESFIKVVPWQYGFVLAVALSFFMLAFIGMSNLWQNILSFVLYLVYCLVWGGLFVYSTYYIPFIGTIFYLAADLLACLAYRFYQSVKEKQFITQIAASFANKDTVEELRRNPDAFKTEGQKKTITALFSDVQKFSTLSESIGKMYGDEGPNKLIEILNEYLGQMSNEILFNNGNIDKYEGDAIISMFGAPDPMNSHTPGEWAYLCLDSAVRMKKVEVEFNTSHADLFEPKKVLDASGKEIDVQLMPLQTRIGLNSGEAFVGLMGSKTDNFSKLNYTMIGDTVNLASRLEGVNKAYNSWIMCSDSTWNLANSGQNRGLLTVRRLDQVRVVGRSTPVQLYNVVGFTNELSAAQKEEIDIFHTALDKYLERDFINAGKLFIEAHKIFETISDPVEEMIKEIKKDKYECKSTALVFADRCKNFIQNGVPENWDGVINMTSK